MSGVAGDEELCAERVADGETVEVVVKRYRDPAAQEEWELIRYPLSHFII